MLCLFREIAVAIADFGTDIFFERFRFSFVLGSPLSCDFAFRLPFVISGACLGGSVLSADYRSEGC